MPSQTNARYISLAGAIAIFFVYGSVYSIPNYAPYLTSYFRHLTGQSGQSYYSLMMTLQTFGFILGQMISLPIMKIFKGKLLIVVSFESLLYVLGIFLGSYFYNAYLIIFCQIFSLGIMGGILYYTMLTFLWEIFPDIKSKITGIALFSVALSPSLYNYFTHVIVNHDDHPANDSVMEKGLEVKYFGSEIFSKVPLMFKYQSLLNLGILTLGCLLLGYG